MIILVPFWFARWVAGGCEQERGVRGIGVRGFEVFDAQEWAPSLSGYA